MSIRLNGATSGSIEIDVPAVAGTDTAITIPATSGGEFIVSDSAGDVNIDSGTLFVDASTDRVGIGTTTVDELLHIEDNVANYGPALKIANPNVNRWGGKIDFESASGTTLYTAATIKADGGSSSTSGNLIFETAGGERIRITDDGYVFLGGHFSTNVVAIRPGAAGQLILLSNNGGLLHQIGSSYFTVTTSGGSTSDVTLKTDIQPIADSLHKLSQIRGVTFSFIDEPFCHSDRGQQIGVIAQEVEPVFPEAVVTGEDGIKAVRYDKLVAPLIEALKEAKERIETLETKVAALEGGTTP